MTSRSAKREGCTRQPDGKDRLRATATSTLKCCSRPSRTPHDCSPPRDTCSSPVDTLAKRQELAVEAMAHVRSGTRLVIAGPPDSAESLVALERAIEQHGVRDRVTLWRTGSRRRRSATCSHLARLHVHPVRRGLLRLRLPRGYHSGSPHHVLDRAVCSRSSATGTPAWSPAHAGGARGGDRQDGATPRRAERWVGGHATSSRHWYTWQPVAEASPMSRVASRTSSRHSSGRGRGTSPSRSSRSSNPRRRCPPDPGPVRLEPAGADHRQRPRDSTAAARATSTG